MKNQGWTTLEQSNKLVEAGLDPETADMWYAERYRGYTDEMGRWFTDKEPFYYLCLVKPSYDNWSIDVIKDIPCWSLGRLMELMPFDVVASKSDGDWFVMFDRDEEHSDQFSDKTLIGALYKAIEWLLKNNYIKKGGEK